MLVLFLGFHDLHDLGVDDELALLGYFGLLGLASLNLLFHGLNRDEGHSDGLVSKVLVNCKLLVIVIEFGVLFLLDNQVDLWLGHREKGSIKLLFRDLRLFLDLTVGEHIIASLIVHVKNCSLEDINDKLVGLLQEFRVYFNVTVLIKPLKLPIGMLVAVELFESDLESAQHRRNLAHNGAFNRPVTCGEHFRLELNSAKRSSGIFSFEFILHNLAVLHIFKHGGHVINNVQTALDFEFLQHQLLGFLTDGGLIEQTFGQIFRVSFDKDISTVKAAEEAHNSLKSLVNLLVTHLFKTFTHLHVRVVSHKLGSVLAGIHESLESCVTTLLELHIVGERIINKIVHFFL